MAGFPGSFQPLRLAQNLQTGTTYTIATTDEAAMVQLSNGGGITVTVPADTTTFFATGAQVNLIQTGAGQVIIAGFTAATVEYFQTPRVSCGTIDGTNWAVYEFVDAGSGAANSAIGLENGTQIAAATGSSKTFGTRVEAFSANGANYAPADIAEIIVYAEGKTVQDRSTIRSYLGSKYGITVS